MRGWWTLWLALLPWCTGCESVELADAGRRDAGAPCASRADCDDGVFCNGSETCRASRCEPGPPPCFDVCDEAGRGCGDCMPPDADRDGHAAIACGGDDCDDADPDRYPGNVEVCDEGGVDEDCIPETVGIRDLDRDGEISSACCNETADRRVCGSDCDDERDGPAVTGPETCDGADEDCDGVVDEDATCSLPLAIGACVEGRCVVVSCPEGRMDCDGAPASGCEQDVLTNRITCGDCDTRCGPMQTCVLGRCEGSPCPHGTHACATGCERDDAVTSCGSRCAPCPTIEGGEAVCNAGACDVSCPYPNRPRFDEDGVRTCAPLTGLHVEAVEVTTPTESRTYPYRADRLLRARVGSSLVTLRVLMSAEDPDVRIRIGDAERAPGEPFDPVEVAVGRSFPIEILYRDAVQWRQTIDVYFGHEPVVLGEGIAGEFGAAVAIDGDVLVVGARFDASGATGVNGDSSDTSEPYAGAAHVYERTSLGWVHTAYLKPFTRVGRALFGSSVAVRGDVIAVGAPGVAGSGGETESGAVYVFRRVGGVWTTERRIDPPTLRAYARFGNATTVYADGVLTGTPSRVYAHRISDGAFIADVGDLSGGSIREGGGLAVFPSSSYELRLYEQVASGWAYLGALPFRGVGWSTAVHAFDVAPDRSRLVIASPYLRVWSASDGSWTLSATSTEGSGAVVTEAGVLMRDDGDRIIRSPIDRLDEQDVFERLQSWTITAADLDHGVAVFGGPGRVRIYDNREDETP